VNQPYYLPEGLPIPTAEPSGLFAPYWQGARQDKLMVQISPKTGAHQWPPEWICQDNHEFQVDWIEVEPRGRIFSWTRIWHPVHPTLMEAGPYIVVIVELPHAGGVRMVGNLLGDPQQEVEIGAAVEAVFEHHQTATPPYTLVQWRLRT
jgi:uncharacterized protein